MSDAPDAIIHELSLLVHDAGLEKENKGGGAVRKRHLSLFASIYYPASSIQHPEHFF